MRLTQTPLVALSVTSLTLLLLGCTTTSSQMYANNQPRLNIEKFFNGSLAAHGIVLNRAGDLTRSVSISMRGYWQYPAGVLAEKIHYNDGENQLREWHFQFQDAHHFTASAKDAVGLATGTQFGNAVHMLYTLNVPVAKHSYTIQFDDWLYMTTGGKVINRTTLSKYGINLGEVIITYDKK